MSVYATVKCFLGAARCVRNHCIFKKQKQLKLNNYLFYIFFCCQLCEHLFFLGSNRRPKAVAKSSLGQCQWSVGQCGASQVLLLHQQEKTIGGKSQFGWPFNNFLPSHKIANVLQSSCLRPTLLYSMSHIALTVVHLLGRKLGLIMHGLIYPLNSLKIECA